jgi:hypothetical protein
MVNVLFPVMAGRSIILCFESQNYEIQMNSVTLPLQIKKTVAKFRTYRYYQTSGNSAEDFDYYTYQS